MTERMISLRDGHRIWSRQIDGGPGLPLLVLHGGPGAGHDYLEPLEALARGRPVIFFDQLGCGRSDKPDDPALWTIGRCADEVAEVRSALGLQQCHILGHSSGGWLGIEYALRKPAGVASLILASTAASMPLFAAECARLIAEMPYAHQLALSTHGAAGNLDHPDYVAALNEFYARHVCRLLEWPDCMARTGANLLGNQVYETMNGPNEFTLTGNLRDWDRTAELQEMDLPVLITCGRYDEMGPVCAEAMQSLIQGSRTVIFESSAHVAHIEEPEKYLQVVGNFLAEVESVQRPDGAVGFRQ